METFPMKLIDVDILTLVLLVDIAPSLSVMIYE